MKIGAMELVVIFIVALVDIGPDKLQELAKKLCAGLRAFREATNDLTSEIRENVVEPLEEAQAPIREAMEPLEEMDKEIKGSVKEVKTSLNNIGKPKKKPAAEKTQQAPAAEAPETPAAETAAPEPVQAPEAVTAPPAAAPDASEEPEAVPPMAEDATLNQNKGGETT
ncbi:MAG: twin-arginine translocase TatA/TatE family subunit [Clostridiales bacterium]|nr:twin-arginine translocase TatA/TatE family subunit [Clostridiales bacterium]